jgi:threonine synthase
MKFKSTRGTSVDSFLEAFNAGLAADGGLFVPEYFPDIKERLEYYRTLSYPALVAEFFTLFDDEISKEEWTEITEKAYSDFSVPDKVQLVELSPDLSVLELFHGPTLAFKDFALQVVGQLYSRECQKKGKTYTILGATSGDTGSAAIYGVLGNNSIRIFIMYPDGKIAPQQELQITTTGAQNVFPVAIQGTFDDAQTIVKQVFSDKNFAEEIHLAAVNSINIARILAQSAYYLFTYLKIKTNKHIKFLVPTGNFGNVLSGWMLTNMGVDCSFVLGTNENDVLHQVWQTGEYIKKDSKVTHAPSMDIQQASNFERLLYYMYDGNTERVREVLDGFKNEGRVKIDVKLLPSLITSTSTSNNEIENIISEFYVAHNYILDPHTACAYKGIDTDSYNIIVSTASPAKFPEIIEKSIGIIPADSRLEALKDEKKVFVKLPADLEIIKKYITENK